MTRTIEQRSNTERPQINTTFEELRQRMKGKLLGESSSRRDLIKRWMDNTGYQFSPSIITVEVFAQIEPLCVELETAAQALSSQEFSQTIELARQAAEAQRSGRVFIYPELRPAVLRIVNLLVALIVLLSAYAVSPEVTQVKAATELVEQNKTATPTKPEATPTPSPTPTPEKVIAVVYEGVTKVQLNIRKEPNANSEKLGALPANTKFEIQEVGNGWGKLVATYDEAGKRVARDAGFISLNKDYVTLAEEARRIEATPVPELQGTGGAEETQEESGIQEQIDALMPDGWQEVCKEKGIENIQLTEFGYECVDKKGDTFLFVPLAGKNFDEDMEHGVSRYNKDRSVLTVETTGQDGKTYRHDFVLTVGENFELDDELFAGKKHWLYFGRDWLTNPAIKKEAGEVLLNAFDVDPNTHTVMVINLSDLEINNVTGQAIVRRENAQDDLKAQYMSGNVTRDDGVIRRIIVSGKNANGEPATITYFNYYMTSGYKAALESNYLAYDNNPGRKEYARMGLPFAILGNLINFIYYIHPDRYEAVYLKALTTGGQILNVAASLTERLDELKVEHKLKEKNNGDPVSSAFLQIVATN